MTTDLSHGGGGFIFIFGIVIMACAWRSYPVCVRMFGRAFVGLGVGFGLGVCLLFGFVNRDGFGNNTKDVAAILSLLLGIQINPLHISERVLRYTARRTRHLVQNDNQCSRQFCLLLHFSPP